MELSGWEEVVWSLAGFVSSFFTYVANLSIGFYWIELYRSNGVGAGKEEMEKMNRIRQRTLWSILFGTSSFWIAAGILGYFLGIWEAVKFALYIIFVPIIAVGTAVIFIFNGRRLYLQMVHSHRSSIVTREKRLTMRNIGRVAVLGAVAFSVRGVIAAFFNVYLAYHMNKEQQMLVMLCFVLATTLIPMFFVVVILRGKSGRALSRLRSTIQWEPDENLIDKSKDQETNEGMWDMDASTDDEPV
eukprot:TRINITY_DN24757_c0_g1_i1.p1 TRINITY_DN24757_c0_g1~~TRINITY_DN24757_c0_g1_i1.p1  ORF type:complete len:244 (+),score=61.09 TRINITY_DN24757_c0_g1_i1:331-1062(+)